MTIREKVLIKLLALLINFIGKTVEGYYGWELDKIISELEQEKDNTKKDYKGV